MSASPTHAMELALGLANEDHENGSVAGDQQLALDVARWEARFQSLDASAGPITPSASLWDRVAAATAALPQTQRSATVTALPKFKPARLHGLGWPVAAALAASLAVTLATRAPTSLRPEAIAVLSTSEGTPSALVESFADGSARLIPLQTIPLPAGRALQVWTLRNPAEGPISIGLLDRAATINLDVRNLPRPDAGQLFEITLEPATGSPTGRPTGPVLSKGLTKIPL